jgi:TPR repeat protein
MKLLLLLITSIISAADNTKQYVDVTGWEAQISYDDALIQFISHAKKVCFKGHAMSCQFIGEDLSVGDPAKKNHFEANRYFRQGCELNLSISCSHLAYAYEHGLGIRQDSDAAWELYGKACDLGSQDSCNIFAAYNRAAQKRK